MPSEPHKGRNSLVHASEHTGGEEGESREGEDSCGEGDLGESECTAEDGEDKEEARTMFREDSNSDDARESPSGKESKIIFLLHYKDTRG